MWESRNSNHAPQWIIQSPGITAYGSTPEVCERNFDALMADS